MDISYGHKQSALEVLCRHRKKTNGRSFHIRGAKNIFEFRERTWFEHAGGQLDMLVAG